MQEIINSLNLFDYVCIGILLICMLSGLMKGFVKEVSGVISLLLSVVIAKIVSIPITLKVYEYFNVREAVLGKLESVVAEVYADKVNASVEELKLGIETVLSKFSFIGNYISKSVTEDFGVYEILAKGGDNFVKDLSIKLMSQLEPVILYMLSIVLFIVICILVFIIVKIVMKSLSSIIKKIPLVGSMNSLLGMSIGCIKGACLVVLITLGSFLIISIFTNIDGEIAKTVLNSRFFELISNFKHLVS